MLLASVFAMALAGSFVCITSVRVWAQVNGGNGASDIDIGGGGGGGSFGGGAAGLGANGGGNGGAGAGGNGAGFGGGGAGVGGGGGGLPSAGSPGSGTIHGLTNTGAISGGVGGPTDGSGGGAGIGGGGGDAAGGSNGGDAGFTITNSTITNSGTVAGGAGGANGGGGGDGIGAGGAGLAGGAGGAGLNGLTINNSGTIEGGAGGPGGSPGPGGVGISGSGMTVVNSGTISGGFSSDGVTLTNAITFTGGVNSLTIASTSTITGNVAAFSAADTLALGGATNGSFDVGQIGAQYQNFGLFQKTGASAWTLTGTNATALPWTVNAGTLQVDATIANSTMIVNSGGTLAGTGTVGATTINSGGVFMPGAAASPGSSITVAGNLALRSGANYSIYLNPTTSTFANVTGSASLAGSVSANFASGSYLSRKYTILTAAGGLGGTAFGSLTNVNLPSGFTTNLSYDADDAFLNLTAILGAPSTIGLSGLNQNQLNVANAVNNSFNGGAALPPSFVGLFSLSGGNLANALTALSGESANGAQQSAFQFGNSFLSLMLDPYAENRGSGLGGADGFGPALGYAGDEGAPPAIGSAFSALDPAISSPTLAHWNLWGQAFGGGEQVSGNGSVGSHNTTGSAGGFAAGADYHISPDAMLGFALAGGATGWSVSGQGSGSSDVFQAGLYGAKEFGQAYVSGALAFGDYAMTTNRSVTLPGGDSYRANFNAQSYSGRLESGYHIAFAPLTLTPYAALQVQAFEAPAYAESAANGATSFALNYNSQSATETRFELGAWADKTIALPGGDALKLFGRLAWAHDWQSNPSIEASFIGLPTASFVVDGARPAPDQALVSAGLEWRLAKDWTLTTKFDGEFGKGSQLYAGTARVAYSW
jgi:uncharacterized protein with beta-barrel porin domain